MRNLSAVAGIVFAASFVTAQGFTIQFDYTYDTSSFFSSGSDARDRLEDAGSFFEGIIADDFDAIAPSGGDSWSIRFSNPSSNAPGPTINNPTIPADTIIVYVGAYDLSGSTLGQAGPGGWSGGGSAAWIDNIIQRGETGPTRKGAGDPPATDYAPWGGSLSMDSVATWDYSLDGSTLGAGENHFYSVLIHEMAHILGYGNQPSTVNPYSSSWEESISGTNFTGAASVAEFGGNVPLQPSLGHWAEGTMSTIVGTSTAQEAAMDPTITVGTAKFWTDLDNAGLTDIGWEIVAPIPEPSTGLLALFGFLSIAARRRRN